MVIYAMLDEDFVSEQHKIWGYNKLFKTVSFWISEKPFSLILLKRAKLLLPPFYASNLVSISLSFQTTTFHNSPPHPRTAHPPVTNTLSDSLSLSSSHLFPPYTLAWSPG